MNRSTWIKRAVATFLVVLMSIESFAAVVGDNDGAAFITKAEFESLKNDFQSQINQYNASLDSKIDGAIASYLAGISVSSVTLTNTLNAGEWEAVDTEYKTDDYTWRYKYGSPRIEWTFAQVGPMYNTTPNYKKESSVDVWANMPAPTLADAHYQHKLCVSIVNATNRTASWTGTAYKAYDSVTAMSAVYSSSFGVELTDASTNYYISTFRADRVGPYKWENYSGKGILNFIWSKSINADDYSTEGTIVSQNVVHNWGKMQQQKIILVQNSKPYMNFNRYPDQRNWGFYTNPTTTTDNTSYEKLWTDTPNVNQNLPSQMKNCWGTNGQYWAYKTQKVSGLWDFQPYNVVLNFANKFGWRSGFNENVFGRTDLDPKAAYFVWPGCGFEESYITNWNQLYTTFFDGVAKDTDLKDKTVFLKDDNNNYHVGIKNGIPLVKIEKNESKIKYDIELINNTYDISTGNKTSTVPTTDCYVWFSDEPFTGWPNDQPCLAFNPLNSSCEKGTATNFNKAVKVPASKNGKAQVEIIAPSGKKYLWVKWATNGQYGGGTLVVPEKVTIETTS